MITFGWILVGISAIAIFAPLFYFRRQKLKCEKYPFFKLRDDALWDVINGSADDKQALWDTYLTINSVIDDLKRFDVGFFAKALADVLHDKIERAYACRLNPAYNWEEERKQLHPLMIKCIELIIKTAKSHSILVRLTLTRRGRWLFVTASIPVVVMRFLRNHPEIFKRAKAQRNIAIADSIIRGGCSA